MSVGTLETLFACRDQAPGDTAGFSRLANIAYFERFYSAAISTMILSAERMSFEAQNAKHS
jgi:hypothetical protein